MYFAAFLFWITGIVALIITLVTTPDEKYRVTSETETLATFYVAFMLLHGVG